MAEPPARSTIEIPEIELDGVKPEDQQLVREVISVLQVLQAPRRLIRGWAVNPCGTTHYDIIGHIDTKAGDWEVHQQDLDLLKGLDLARIAAVSVRVQGVSHQLYVKIMSRGVAVMVTECDVIRIQKKRRWYF